MQRVVFVLSSIQDSHALKRVSEFVERGFEVVIYGFSRGQIDSTSLGNIKIHVIGSFSNALPYYKRLYKLCSGMRKVRKIYERERVLWFYFGLDIVLFAKLVGCKGKYIYEECDLVHTYLPCKLLRIIFEKIDLFFIQHSFFTILTSEGFLRYHLMHNAKLNKASIKVIPNRLNTNILNFPQPVKKKIDLNHMAFAFVGGARFDSLLSFVEIILRNFPQHTFHFFGNPVQNYKTKYDKLGLRYQNVFFHGAFKNPNDLSKIYSQIDILVITYDSKYDNVRFAEPNKIYEAIYFETPVVVTKGTFLSEKVQRLNIGFSVSPFDEADVIRFVNNLTEFSVMDKILACKKIDKKDCLNFNDDFFKELDVKLKIE